MKLIFPVYSLIVKEREGDRDRAKNLCKNEIQNGFENVSNVWEKKLSVVLSFEFWKERERERSKESRHICWRTD